MASYSIGSGFIFGHCGYQSMSTLLTGLRAWVLQRASAIYLLLFVVLMPIVIAFEKIDNLEAWQGFISSPMVVVTSVLFFISLFAHAWVGIRDVIIDYVHSFNIRVFLLFILAVYLIVMLAWVLRILLLATGAPA